MELQELKITRQFVIPISHGLLMLMTLISSSDRIPFFEAKQSFSFLAMIIYTNMILIASQSMNYYHYPLAADQTNTVSMQTSYLWLIIEQLVFIFMIISNMLYLGLRSCFRNKLQLDLTDARR